MPQMGRSLIEVNIDASNGLITDQGCLNLADC